MIWRGTSSRMQPSVWKYAQFEKDILECSIYILTDVRKLPPSSCADAVSVARALSAGVKFILLFSFVIIFLFVIIVLFFLCNYAKI